MKTSSRVYLNKEFGLLSASWCSPACPTRRKGWSLGPCCGCSRWELLLDTSPPSWRCRRTPMDDAGKCNNRMMDSRAGASELADPIPPRGPTSGLGHGTSHQHPTALEMSVSNRFLWLAGLQEPGITPIPKPHCKCHPMQGDVELRWTSRQSLRIIFLNPYMLVSP